MKYINEETKGAKTTKATKRGFKSIPEKATVNKADINAISTKETKRAMPTVAKPTNSTKKSVSKPATTKRKISISKPKDNTTAEMKIAIGVGQALNQKYKIQKSERSAHNETIEWNSKRRIAILEQIFGYELTNWGKATINLSNPWMISDISTHYTRPVIADKREWCKYTNERIAIKKSCDYQRAVINRVPRKYGTMPKSNNQVYARIIDLPDNRLLLAILKDMKAHGCKDYEAYKIYKLGAEEAAKFQGGRPTDIQRRKERYQETHTASNK